MKNQIIPIGLGTGKVSQFSISENINQNDDRKFIVR